MSAERLGDRAHVAAGAQAHRKLRHWLLVFLELELVDRRPARRHLDGYAAPVELVRPLAADLDRGCGGDLEVDLAAEGVQLRLELEERRRLVLVDDLALRIARGRRPREVDGRLVPLLQPDELLRLLRETPEQDEQEPGRERVERPRMPGPRARLLAQLPHDRERRGAGRLVVEDEPARVERPLTRHCEPRRTRGG